MDLDVYDDVDASVFVFLCKLFFEIADEYYRLCIEYRERSPFQNALFLSFCFCFTYLINDKDGMIKKSALISLEARSEY